MPQVSELTSYAQQALLLSLVVSLPVVGAAAVIGLVIAVLQAATQVQDITLSHLPRLIVVAVVLAIAAPWMGAQIAAFAARMFALG
ncbi:MAG TPA: type III secretion system export apparatus subunit SctS [Polyangiaceae bacterium]|nr:type III secretion system export apparatus subunit SctS [Polyangiaceae bacterium]